MISEIANQSGIRCVSCKQVPASWFAATCPGSCGYTFMACGRCASRAVVEEQLDEHVVSCAAARFATVARGDLQSTLQGIVDAARGQNQVRNESLTRRAARVGRQIGARRGARGEQVGALTGAVVGALSDHVLGKPEMQPALRAAKAMASLAGAVTDALSGDEMKEKK